MQNYNRNPSDLDRQMRWEITAATTTGPKYISANQGNDDAFAYTVINDDILLIAIADGAGSHTGTSSFGSYLAVKTAIEKITTDKANNADTSVDEDAWPAYATHVFQTVLDVLIDESRQRNASLEALSTTLALGLVIGDRGFFAQIGDGIIVARSMGKTQTLIPEEKLESINLTYFITGNGNIQHQLRCTVVDGVDALVMSTDGMTYGITDTSTGQAFEPFFATVWEKQKVEHLDESSLEKQLSEFTSDPLQDDKTLVIASRSYASSYTVPTSPVISPAPKEWPPTVVDNMSNTNSNSEHVSLHEALQGESTSTVDSPEADGGIDVSGSTLEISSLDSISTSSHRDEEADIFAEKDLSSQDVQKDLTQANVRNASGKPLNRVHKQPTSPRRRYRDRFRSATRSAAHAFIHDFFGDS